MKTNQIDCYNLGTGHGYSVLEIVNTFEKITNVKIPYQIVERRSGDIAECYADPSYAKQELNFTCTKTLEDMVRTAINILFMCIRDSVTTINYCLVSFQKKHW